MRKTLTLLLAAVLYFAAHAQSPVISSWVINTKGTTGYSGIQSNVQKVQYTDSFVYVTCTGIPSYTIGPWTGNPNKPKNQNFCFKIPRYPKRDTSGKPAFTPNGHTGVWTNGVTIFNAKDANSYNNMKIWNQNAIVVEGVGFDNCLGHPNQDGEYHHHLNPKCLYNDKDSSKHSPIIGYSFDGFPIYGAYGYSSAKDTSSKITRMRTSYRLRSITDRTSLAIGPSLTSSQYGPSVSTTYPLGYYVEDYEFVKDQGTLDPFNGRFCITPEYPQGTYAYFITIDASQKAEYPYTTGPMFHGYALQENMGPNSGHSTVPTGATTYTTDVEEYENNSDFNIYPNPTGSDVNIVCTAQNAGKTYVKIYNMNGQLVFNSQSENGEKFVVSTYSLPAGIYRIHLMNGNLSSGKTLNLIK